METPICDFVRDYCARDALRLHMPGHKGRALLGMEPLDITEFDGADELYGAGGIIRQSEENAARLFGAARTVYSAEGSSLCIRAMLYLALLHARETGLRPAVAAGRNAHKVFLTAAALTGLEVDWLYPESPESLLACGVEPAALESYLDTHERPAAVYVTSPDYLGNLADIRALSAVCRRRGVLLLVDNAHGAYLHFLPEPCHPLDLGADICCDSAHKTLPALTGAAYLHFSASAPAALRAQAENALSVFASTSPSYLILQSLDAVNRVLAGDYRARLSETAQRTDALKARLEAHGFALRGHERTKLTLAPKAFGYTGDALAARLREADILFEFHDPDYLVAMFTPSTAPGDFDRLERALCAVERRPPILTAPPLPGRPARASAPRSAMLSPIELLPVENCLGRVLASANVGCPPAIPIVACGERIDENALRCFRYYGIETCFVVKEPPEK